VALTISFFIGRTLDRLIREYGRSFHATPERIDLVRQWFQRFGAWILVFGYFIPGVRQVTAIVAGMTQLRPLTFALFAYAGALLWSTSFVTIGLLLGDRWTTFINAFEHHLKIAAVVLAIAAAFGFMCLRRSRTRKR
jgi:membrane protein DedA with SNARE-associated domain